MSESDSDLKEKRRLVNLSDVELKMYEEGLVDSEGELTSLGVDTYVQYLYDNGVCLEDFWEYMDEVLE